MTTRHSEVIADDIQPTEVAANREASSRWLEGIEGAQGRHVVIGGQWHEWTPEEVEEFTKRGEQSGWLLAKETAKPQPTEFDGIVEQMRSGAVSEVDVSELKGPDSVEFRRLLERLIGPSSALARMRANEEERVAEHGWLGEAQLVTLEGRCSGHCCRSFFLSVDPERLAVLAEQSRSNRAADPAALATDAEFVEQHMEYVETTDIDPYDGSRRGKRKPVFKCNALSSNGDCSKYQDRPQLCRNYGRDYSCYHPNCTLKRVVGERYIFVGPPNVQETSGPQAKTLGADS